jgi:uncharacterized protein (UPF0335 family)
MDKSFSSQVIEEIERLREENQRLDEDIKPLLAKIEENKRKVEHLQAYLGVSKEPISKTLGDKALEKMGIDLENLPTARRFRRGDIEPENNEKQIGKLAIKILKKIGQPSHYRVLMETIEREEKIKIPGKNPRANFTAHLSNEAGIVGQGKGIYALREWYE